VPKTATCRRCRLIVSVLPMNITVGVHTPSAGRAWGRSGGVRRQHGLGAYEAVRARAEDRQIASWSLAAHTLDCKRKGKTEPELGGQVVVLDSLGGGGLRNRVTVSMLHFICTG
jgi:hypothetical protein